MATEIIMPKLGLTMTEGTIVEWLKREGDPVKKGERLLVVETDKVTLDVEAEADGILLKISAPVGSIIPLAEIIGYIGAAGESPPQTKTAAPAAAAPAPAPASPQAAPAAPAGLLRVSPIAKKLAAEHNIDLNTVVGSGPQGRIVEADIYKAIEQGAQPKTPPPPAGGLPGRLEPLNSIRRLAARRMSESFQTAPHFYLGAELNIARLVELRNALQPDAEARLHIHLTYTDFILRALALTLPNHPLLNAAYNDQVTIRIFSDINLGLAVATPQGLVVPVIHEAQKHSLHEIAAERTRLALKAKDHKLSPAELEGATFTLTNLGMYGVDDFHPILNPPQSAILAVGAVVERPVAEEGQVVLRPTLRLTLAVDHRVADGADGALFLKDLRAALEQPESI